MSKVIILAYIAFVFVFTGCKFSIKEYQSSIGELTAETVKR